MTAASTPLALRRAQQRSAVVSAVVSALRVLSLATSLGLAWAGSTDTTGAVTRHTAIPAIQGTGARSPLEGRWVLTSGVVTLLHSQGFFLQDPVGDGNPLSSDGIFVFTGSAPVVAIGQHLQLRGLVVEFQPAASDAQGRSVTQLVRPTDITVLATGLRITPVPISLPVAHGSSLERYEGMLVTVNGPLTVQQTQALGRHGQLTLAAGGRLETPTNRLRPGPQAAALADENARRSIVLDDGSNRQHPNPIPYLASGVRAGDTTGDITGVLDDGAATPSALGLDPYRIHPVSAPRFSPTHARSSAPEPVGGHVKVASFNLLNYFSAFSDGGGTADGCRLGPTISRSHCRGASNAGEFSRQQAKIVAALAAIDADAIGLMEIQNNGNVAVQGLVDALNAGKGARQGPDTYASTTLPADTGSDAIRVAIIYKPARLTPLGVATSDKHAVNSRPTLAQSFSLANGAVFTLVVSHFKSKGGCPAATDAGARGNTDMADGQGCWNLLRQQQAQRLLVFVTQRLAATHSSDALLIGDFNAYAQEDPIHLLAGGGFSDQLQRFNAFGYSYVFNGAAGRLDHALANASLAAKVHRALHWHINADEPAVLDYNTEFKAPAGGCGLGACPPDPTVLDAYRSSDHDPVVIGLDFGNTATAGARPGTALAAQPTR